MTQRHRNVATVMGWANLDLDLFDLVASKLPAVEDLCAFVPSS